MPGQGSRRVERQSNAFEKLLAEASILAERGNELFVALRHVKVDGRNDVVQVTERLCEAARRRLAGRIRALLLHDHRDRRRAGGRWQRPVRLALLGQGHRHRGRSRAGDIARGFGNYVVEKDELIFVPFARLEPVRLLG